MKKSIIPTITKKGVIEKVKILPNLILGTTVGLVKSINEDRVGCSIDGNSIRICVEDGHWGKKAAKMIVDHWVRKGRVFPNGRTEAIPEVLKIEQKLFKLFGKINMDPNSDFTPEASFIVMQLVGESLKVISYGDCRLLIAKEGTVKTKLTTKETWLGAFSHLGLRKRLSVKNAIKFKKIKVVKGDFIFLFTDGVDQCVYEKDTISFDFIAGLSKLSDLNKVFDKLMEEVFTNGAQDNASLAILRF